MTPGAGRRGTAGITGLRRGTPDSAAAAALPVRSTRPGPVPENTNDADGDGRARSTTAGWEA